MANRKRDFQRKRVYQAEWAVVKAMKQAGTLERLAPTELRETVAETWDAMGFAHYQCPKVELISRRATRMAAYYSPRAHKVGFAPHLDGATQMIVCHELSHAVTWTAVMRGEVAPHGPEFVAIYLRAVGTTMPEPTYNTLRHSLQLHRVKVAS